MITLLLWLCPFTWPFAIRRMRRRRDARLIAAMGGTPPTRRQGPVEWLLRRAWQAATHRTATS